MSDDDLNIAEYINSKRFTSLGKVDNDELIKLIKFVEKSVFKSVLKDLNKIVSNGKGKTPCGKCGIGNFIYFNFTDNRKEGNLCFDCYIKKCLGDIGK